MKRRSFLSFLASAAAAPLIPSLAKEPDKELWPKGGVLIQDKWTETLSSESLCEKFKLDYAAEVERRRLVEASCSFCPEVLAEKVLVWDSLDHRYLPSYEGPSRWLYAVNETWTQDLLRQYRSSACFEREFFWTNTWYRQSESECVKLPWFVTEPNFEVSLKNIMLMHLIRGSSGRCVLSGVGDLRKRIEVGCDLLKQNGFDPAQLIINMDVGLGQTLNDCEAISQKLGYQLKTYLTPDCKKHMAYLLAAPEYIGVYVTRYRWESPSRMIPLPDWAMGVYYQNDAIVGIPTDA
jgi:hypothetical protein